MESRGKVESRIHLFARVHTAESGKSGQEALGSGEQLWALLVYNMLSCPIPGRRRGVCFPAGTGVRPWGTLGRVSQHSGVRLQDPSDTKSHFNHKASVMKAFRQWISWKINI